MKHDSAAELLNDYIDGVLEAPMVTDLQNHVRQCVTCRRELEGLKQVLEGAAALPRVIEPPRDLWPAIAEATRPKKAAVESSGARMLRRLGFFSWSWPTALATTAVVGVLCISSFNTEPLVPAGEDVSRTGVPAGAVNYPETDAVLLALEAECQQGEQELAAYNGHSGPVSHMLQQSMPVVDRAIAEARAAWVASPDEPGLTRLLTSAYRAKVALQGRAIRMASES